jgi:hypothetical protein
MKFKDLKIGVSFFIISEMEKAKKTGKIQRYEKCEEAMVDRLCRNAYLPGTGRHELIDPDTEVVVFIKEKRER